MQGLNKLILRDYMYTDQGISSLIEYTTFKFFLNLGRLNGDEVCDTPEIKYIFTKNGRTVFSWQISASQGHIPVSCM